MVKYNRSVQRSTELIEVRDRLLALPQRSAEIGCVKGLPPRSAYSVMCISGCVLNRCTAVIGLMESYRMVFVYDIPPKSR